MREKITKILDIIEKSHNVKILYACESGSRAWGFDSEDSDYDIRFVYTKPWDQYLTVFPITKDTIDRNSSEVCKSFVKHDLDFSGWDIRKVGYQMAKGNPDMISWFYSPIIYREYDCISRIRELAEKFFKNKSAFYHYEHMANRNYRQYIKNVDGQVKAKKYLYVLRPLLACMWIKFFNNAPPMLFENVYTNKYIKDILINESIYTDLVRLIIEKRSGKEMEFIDKIPKVDTFCEKYLWYFKEEGEQAIVKEKTQEDWDEIDQIFRDIVINPERIIS